MIIKSMSRKEPSFRQLIAYIDRELGTEAFQVRHNLMGRGHDRVRAEFEENAQLLKRRKNGVYLYHEILSITRARGLPEREQQELLYRIAEQYIAARCPDNLVYGGLHQDKDHSYHMHLMISANRAGDNARLRLTKKQFRDIQVQLEAHVLAKHPELEQQLAIGKRSERKRARGEVEHERRTGRPPSRKEALRGRLQAAYEASDSREAFLAALATQGFRHEPRGKSFARVIDEYTGQAHRVATLDAELAALFEALLQDEPLRDAPDQDRAAAASGGEPAGEKEKTGPRMSREDARAAADQEQQVRTRQTEPEPEPEIEEPTPQQEPAPEDGLSAQQRAWKREMEERRAAKAERERGNRERDRGGRTR